MTIWTRRLLHPTIPPPEPGSHDIRYIQWGALEPYSEDAPDIVKMIHWGADVIVSMNLRHEMLKEQTAYFLYAWPWIKKWLPQQNYEVVSEFAFDQIEVVFESLARHVAFVAV